MDLFRVQSSFLSLAFALMDLFALFFEALVELVHHSETDSCVVAVLVVLAVSFADRVVEAVDSFEQEIALLERVFHPLESMHSRTRHPGAHFPD